MELLQWFVEHHLKNKGFNLLLDAVAMYLPAPTEVADIKGETQDGDAITFLQLIKVKLQHCIQKIMTDPFVGQLTFTRIYRGVLESGTYVLNSTKWKRENRKIT